MQGLNERFMQPDTTITLRLIDLDASVKAIDELSCTLQLITEQLTFYRISCISGSRNNSFREKKLTTFDAYCIQYVY